MGSEQSPLVPPTCCANWGQMISRVTSCLRQSRYGGNQKGTKPLSSQPQGKEPPPQPLPSQPPCLVLGGHGSKGTRPTSHRPCTSSPRGLSSPEPQGCPTSQDQILYSSTPQRNPQFLWGIEGMRNSLIRLVLHSITIQQSVLVCLLCAGNGPGCSGRKRKKGERVLTASCSPRSRAFLHLSKL